ncbi:MAG: hypothetical protein BGO13_08600 [Burkholderiales bacterium 66-5]|nr:MAG: hypothetical protein BGO13_08600 [Burkholderiales bacterium 66-5]
MSPGAPHDELQAIDLIEFGRRTAKQAAPIRSLELHALITVAADYFRHPRNPDVGLDSAIGSLLSRCKWHTYFWKFKVQSYRLDDGAPGCAGYMKASIVATAAHYGRGLHESDTNLAAILRSQFAHGACWAFARWVHEGQWHEKETLPWVPAFEPWHRPAE